MTSGSEVENGGVGRPRAVTLEDLIALNDELAALARAGLPIESGLAGLADGEGGRLGALSGRLRDRMARGQGLAEAFRAEGDALPPSYRAVVEAGIRSGRPADAFEGLADYTRQVAELRAAIGQAFVYPLTVLALAYALFVGLVLHVLPAIGRSFEATEVGPRFGTETLAWLDRWAAYWVPIPPALVAGFVLVWWGTRRARTLGEGVGLDRVPWLRGVLRDWRASGFASLLALLIEHEVPLPEALPMAAEAAGGSDLARAANRRAEAIRRGESRVEVPPKGEQGLPPLLRWVLSGSATGPLLASGLRATAVAYRRRAFRGAERIKVVVPSLILVLIGGGAVAILATTLFLPWTTLMDLLARPRT